MPSDDIDDIDGVATDARRLYEESFADLAGKWPHE